MRTPSESYIVSSAMKKMREEAAATPKLTEAQIEAIQKREDRLVVYQEHYVDGATLEDIAQEHGFNMGEIKQWINSPKYTSERAPFYKEASLTARYVLARGAVDAAHTIVALAREPGVINGTEKEKRLALDAAKTLLSRLGIGEVSKAEVTPAGEASSAAQISLSALPLQDLKVLDDLLRRADLAASGD